MIEHLERWPECSVVVPTFNRAAALEQCLRSLGRQSIARDHYEVIVVDDGSTDATAEICRTVARSMPLRLFRVGHGGVSRAKNIAVRAARAPVLLFMDDDDIAHPDLVWQHIAAHRRDPRECTAVLGYTAWSPSIQVTPLMDYVMDVGQLLFAYRDLRDGQRLTFDYFWGGRSSCKTEFFRSRGEFDEAFSQLEDVEAGYRLSREGLDVTFNRRAVSYMGRPLDHDDFCRRSEARGMALALLAARHADPIVAQYCDLPALHERWVGVRRRLRRSVKQVRRLERRLVDCEHRDGDKLLRLYHLYEVTLKGFEARGAAKALRQLGRRDLSKTCS